MSGALQRSPRSDRPTIVEYGALSALLLVLAAILAATRLGVEPALSVVEAFFGPRFASTAVYSALVLTVAGGLAAAYAVSGDRDWGATDPVELVRLGLLASLLVVLGTYAAVVAWQPSIPASSFVVPWLYYLGMTGLAVGYARVRGLAIRTATPTGTDRRVVGLAVLVVAVVVVGAVVVTLGPARALSRLTGGPFGTGGPFAGTSIPVPTLATTVVVPTLLAAVGTGLLFNGVVQESLAADGTPAAAAGAVTGLLVGYEWVSLFALASLDGLAAVPGITVAIMAVVAVAFAYWYLWTEIGLSDRFAAFRATVSVGATLAVVGAAVTASVVAAPIPSIGYAVLPYAVTAGVAAVVYERTETVLAPVAVYATYGLGIEVLQFALRPAFPL